MNQCHICKESLGESSYTIKEQYFGTKEKFQYKQCTNCGCLQINSVPPDMGKYYPDTYYSKKITKQYKNNSFISLFRSFRLEAALKNIPLSYFLTKPRLGRWVKDSGINSKSKILDVGCGAGQRLLRMRKKGFCFLEGVEPFIPTDISYANGVFVHCKDLVAFAKDTAKNESYDMIMMHHSLEHMPDQNVTLAAAYQLLSNGGKLLIGIPLCSSYAWEHYKENWVQLDAPRHLFLHSTTSIEMLANKSGFSLSKLNFDSSEFQFTGSERYMMGMSLIESSVKNLFTEEQLTIYKRKAEALNKEQRGDQAVFIFTKS